MQISGRLLKILLIAMLLLVGIMIPAQAQSIFEPVEFCNDGSGLFDGYPPCPEITTENTCEEPPPEELVCSEENQEAPPSRDNPIDDYAPAGR